MIKRVLLILIALFSPLVFLFSFPFFSSPQNSVQAQGADVAVDKQLLGNPVVRVGEHLTFSISIQNNSMFTITTLPAN